MASPVRVSIPAQATARVLLRNIVISRVSLRRGKGVLGTGRLRNWQSGSHPCTGQHATKAKQPPHLRHVEHEEPLGRNGVDHLPAVPCEEIGGSLLPGSDRSVDFGRQPFHL